LTKSEAEKTAARYHLKFVPQALAEWEALDGSVKEPLRKALKKRLEQPHVPGSLLHGDLHHCYKIKLRKQGWRLIYRVKDEVLIVMVMAVAKREDGVAYRLALQRMSSDKN
jgi:mRNA interferase RelE/StbE